MLCVFTVRGNRFDTGNGESGNSMIAKIIEMLGDEKNKIAEDMKEETAQMNEYFNFCHREDDEKRYQIGRGNRKIDELSALIEDNTAQIAALDEELVDLGTEMSKHEADQAKQDERRKEENGEFKVREAEQIVMVEELERMTVELEKTMAAMTTPPPVEFLQDSTSETQAAPAAALLQVQNAHKKVQDKGSDSFWAQQAIKAKTEIKERQENIIRAKEQLKASAKFRAEVENPNHAAALLQSLGTEGMSAEVVQRIETGLSKALNLLVHDPEAYKPVGVFVQEKAEAPETVTMKAGQVDQMQKTNAENMDAFEGLKKKAEKSLQQERDNESENKHEYMMDKQARVQEMNIIEDKTDKAKENRANFQEEMAEAEGEKKEAEETKAADMKYLQTLNTECETASAAWDERVKAADDEQAAIGKAQEILSSRVKVFLLQVSAHRQMVHNKAPVADSEEAETARVRQKLMAHFRNLGGKLHSLSLLNMANAAASKPLEKVKGLIKELITKLEEEAAEAASTHAWCEEENKKNAKAKKTSEDKLKKVSIRLEKATAKKAELADSITELTAEVADIDKADAEALKIRQEEHKTFVKNEADFKEAEAAVIEAMEVLKDFYGDSVAFIQTGFKNHAPGDAVDTTTKSPIAVQPPAMGGAKSDSAGGILMIMDTMASEFAKTVAELQSTEREAQKAYDKMKNDNEVSKATKEAEIKGMTSETEFLNVNIGDHQDDVAMNKEELQAVLDYIEKLKPTCVGTVMPYEERKAKREAEIEGLQTALQILEETGETLKMVSFLQVQRHSQLL